MVARPIGDDAVRSHWLKLPIELHLRDGKPKKTPITIELSTSDESMLVETIEVGCVPVQPGLSTPMRC